MATNPTCFLSYAWEGKRHERWVRRLAEALVSNGIVTHLDLWETHLGMDLPAYMEKAIQESQFVTLICTPRYAERANARLGGVGYEAGVITGEMFTAMSSRKKFIPVLRGRDPQESLPSFLKSRKYLDARSTRRFETYVRELLHHLWDQPAASSPPIGPRPDLGKPVLIRELPENEGTRLRQLVANTQDTTKAIRQKEKELRQLQRKWPTGEKTLIKRAEQVAWLSSELDALSKKEE
jgi:hypothetical protein